MVDLHTVCCMCGDVGFPDKLFRCSKCCNRFQHSNGVRRSYCSNYYSEYSEAMEICDWCQSEERNPSSSSSSSKQQLQQKNTKHAPIEVRSAYSGDKIKRQEGGGGAEKSAGKSPSPRPSPRRYKLLKDVMC